MSTLREPLPTRFRFLTVCLLGLFGLSLPPVPAAEPTPPPAPTVAPESAPPALMEVVESSGTYSSQGKAIAVERFEPKGPGRFPAVLVIHGAGGTTIGRAVYRETARALAARGYVAHVIHYFDLTGTRIADLPTMRARFPGWMRAVADGITSVSKQPNVDPARVGLVGFSLGSYLSLSVSVFDPRVTAVVEYFGGLPPVLVKEVRSLPPTLILHGEADKVVPVFEARRLERIFRTRGFPHEVCIYPSQGHGFLGPDARDARRRALAFLDEHVKDAELPASRRPTAPVPDPAAFAEALGERERATTAED